MNLEGMVGIYMESTFENIVFPNEMLKGMQIENLIVSPHDHRIAVIPLSGKSQNMHQLRLYQLVRGEDQQFFPTHEIGAFRFYSRKALVDFLTRLPKMSALEILMLIHPAPALTH